MKIKLGHRVSEGLDFKLVNSYRMIILINENNHLNRIIKKNSGISRGLKIKLGHRISEGLDFKLVNKYEILTLMDDNEI